jgi:hypothetical protein
MIPEKVLKKYLVFELKDIMNAISHFSTEFRVFRFFIGSTPLGS